MQAPLPARWSRSMWRQKPRPPEIVQPLLECRIPRIGRWAQVEEPNPWYVLGLLGGSGAWHHEDAEGQQDDEFDGVTPHGHLLHRLPLPRPRLGGIRAHEDCCRRP